VAEPDEHLESELHASAPRAYVNFAHGRGAPLDFGLTVGYREGEANPILIQPLVMSWEFVPILIKLLQDQLDSYQEQLGPIRDLKPERIEETP